MASVPFWYHAMSLAPGVETPGWFDLRPVVDRMPWPDLRGKRCLEVGPYDGFLAFEMERRGASEVVICDIGSPAGWDWPYRTRSTGPAGVAAISGERTGAGFEVAKEILGSSVQRLEVSAYDLDPTELGSFDFVLCASLLLHLRDPVRALEAIRGVCEGRFLSAETIDVPLTLSSPRRPAARLRGGDRCQWWIPNRAAHAKMVEAAGFRTVQATRPYAIPLGPGHPAHEQEEGLRSRLGRLAMAPLLGGQGVPHSALLCVPDAPEAP